MVEVCETKEGLHVADLSGFRPVRNGLYLLLVHGESVGGHDVSEIFHSIGVEFALVCSGEQIVLSESSKDFLDMFCMISGVFGVYKDIVKIDDHADIQ